METTTEDCRNIVASLNDGGVGMFGAVRVLLAHAGLPNDDEAVIAAIRIRQALRLLDA